jgi:hypothetical protein
MPKELRGISHLTGFFSHSTNPKGFPLSERGRIVEKTVCLEPLQRNFSKV